MLNYRSSKKDAEEVNEIINRSIKAQLKRIKKSSSNLRRSRLYLNNMADSISIVNSLVSVCKTCSDVKEFVERDPDNFNMKVSDIAKVKEMDDGSK
jgi:glutamine synthetase adenylyltransferase